jgi:hypothetical protein
MVPTEYRYLSSYINIAIYWLDLTTHYLLMFIWHIHRTGYTRMVCDDSFPYWAALLSLSRMVVFFTLHSCRERFWGHGAISGSRGIRNNVKIPHSHVLQMRGLRMWTFEVKHQSISSNWTRGTFEMSAVRMAFDRCLDDKEIGMERYNLFSTHIRGVFLWFYRPLWNWYWFR